VNKVLRHVVRPKTVFQAGAEAIGVQLAGLGVLTAFQWDSPWFPAYVMAVCVLAVAVLFVRALTSKEVMRERPRSLPGQHPGDHRQ
jgi:hypothetical protein